MKKNHPFLKIAGVKNIDEFYQKFPTEKAFMAKHGAKLRKAEVGDMIGGEQAPMYQPISYNNLASNAQASVYGISPEEQQRQEALASQQAIAAASGQKGGGLADILGGIDPKMIASLIGGAKNGKKLKKFLGGGFVPTDIPEDAFNPQMPLDYQAGNLNNIGQQAFGGIDKFVNSDIGGASSTSTKKGFDFKGLAGKVAPQLGTLIGAYDDIQQGKKDTANAQKYGKISDLTLQAASSRPEQSKRRYVRPEDQVMQNFRPLGTGTNYLAAANGTMIGGNPTEIQNMYDTPNTMYTDLEYEPLTDSNKVKNFKKGGKMNKAAGGVNLDPFSGIGGSLGGMLGSSAGGGSGKGGPGSTIGSTLGGIAGSFIPIPGVGTFLGSTVGGFLGGLFDAEGQNEAQAAQDKLNQNLQASAFQSGTQNLQTQNKAFMEDGGWVSHDWQPQVIATFGEHKVKDLLKPPYDADMLRAGGHLKYYTPPSAEAMNTGRAEYGVQMAMGGDLKVLDGGYAETISYNPYMPGTGETVMFRGRSHDDGGIPIEYGQNGVEVEGGEPMFQMEDGGKVSDNTSGIVAGNLFIPDYGVNEIGDPKAKGKKFKHYIADLSKQEAKINKSVDKGVELVNTYDSGNEFDQLAFNSGKAMMMGGDLKLRTIAERKMDAAAVQNAILDTAEEFGVKSDDLAKGKIKMDKDNNMYAEFGKKVMFQKGGKASNSIDPNDSWISKILDYESKYGSGRGTGLSNFGYNDWEKFGHPNAPRTKQEAIDYFKQDYLPRVDNLPEGLRERMGDWVYNTGKDPRIPLLLAAGKVKSNAFGVIADRIELANNPALLEERWNENSDEILKKAKDPEFLKKVDTAKKIMYQNINKPAIDKINPAYKNTWKGRTDMFSDDIQPIVQQAPVAQQAPIQQTAATAKPVAKAIAQERNMGRIDDEDIIIENRNVKKQVPAPAPVPRYSASSSQFPSPIDEEGNYYMPITQPTPTVGWDGTDDYQYKGNVTNAINQATTSAPEVKDNDWLKLTAMGLTSALGQLRPSDAELLDAAQLAPEMMSLAMNQLEPVQAQTLQPLLSQPTSYSLQDQLNEITSATRAAEKMSAYNPEAASMIAAQAYNAKNKVLGEQFRLNQAEQQRVAEQNRNVLNDTNLKNLAILDTQYQRQEQAKSATKQQAIEAMKSIADKVAKNKLENRQLGVMENLYNYRFNKSGQAYNLNAPQFFNMEGALTRNNDALVEGYEDLYNKAGQRVLTRKSKDSDTGRNGAIVKAIKNL
jgi:hypothetical protein